MNSIEKSFCTTREAAQLLGVSVGTVQLWVERGTLEAWKTEGGHRRVLRSSIEQLLHRPALRLSPARVPEVPMQASPVSPGKAEATPGEVQPTTRRLRVMVVEDDPNLLWLYKAQISRWPMQPQWQGLSNGFAALLALGRSRPDLLILDLHLPEMDGFGMLRVLHSAPEIAHTRIVVVTGMDARGIEARGGLPGGMEILPKPIPFDRLKAIATEIAKKIAQAADTANVDTTADQ